MKHLLPLFLIYVLVQQGGQTIKMTWTNGQPVSDLLNERCARNVCTYQIVGKETFDSTPDSSRAPDPVEQTKIKQAILDAKNQSKTTDQRLEALIQALLP